MYEFFMGGLVLKERQTRSVGIQATEVWSQPVSSQPILIENLKKKFTRRTQELLGKGFTESFVRLPKRVFPCKIA